MKRLLLLIIIVFGLKTTNAQSGYNSINLTYGLTSEEWEEISVAYEFNSKHLNSWELIFVGTRGLNKNYEEFQFGAVYEPLFLKKNDLLMHFRVGGLMGSNHKHFILGPTAGFELSYYIFDRFQIMLQQSNYFIINTDRQFRHSLSGGIKLQF